MQGCMYIIFKITSPGGGGTMLFEKMSEQNDKLDTKKNFFILIYQIYKNLFISP